MKHSAHFRLNTIILLLLMLPFVISCGSQTPQIPSTTATITTSVPQTPKPEPPPPSPKQPELPKDIELKYDDGIPDGSYSAGGYIFRQHFSTPQTPFKINKLKIYSHIRGNGYENQKVEIRIKDKDPKTLFSLDKPATEFKVEESWTIIDLPDITITSDFFVDINFNSKQYGGVYLHYDSSSTNQNSDYLSSSGSTTNWTWKSPKENTCWMIRVIGTN